MSKKIAFLCSIESYKLSDAHIFKDLCLVPILLGEHLGYDVTIVTSEINESLLHQTFPAVAFCPIPFEDDFVANMNAYLREHAQEIDIVFIIGPYPSYLSMLKTYKQYNPNGKIYMKLDVNRFWLSRLMQTSYFAEILALCEVISAECAPIQKAINQMYNQNVRFIPNGFYEFFPTEPVPFEEKRNIILAVGRLDAPEKQMMLAIQAFLAAGLIDWEFHLVGSLSNEFKSEIAQMLEGNPLAKQIKVLGPITDKYLLEQAYRQAKIFLHTSTVECFAHVFAEAAKNGCYLVTTDVDGASDSTQNQRFGKIHATDDWQGIAQTLKEVANQDDLLKATCIEWQQFARTTLNWRSIVQQVAHFLED